MDATQIAPAAGPHREVVGMGLAMVVIAAFALAFLPITALVILGVRCAEWVPRAFHWTGRKLRRDWAR